MTNVPYRRIPNNISRYSLLQEVGPNLSLPHECGMVLVKGKNSNFTVKKPDQHCLNQVIKVHITSVILRVLCTFPLLKTHKKSSHEKNIRQIQSEEHPTKYLTSIPKNFERHEK